MRRVVSWFSCGAASAYATFLARQKYGDIVAVYCKVVNEHPDSLRFLKEYTEATGIPIEIICNEKYGGDIYNVFLGCKYIKNQYGAPCTLHLKKNLRKKYQKQSDIQVFGYTADEQGRADRFIDANPDVNEDFILIEESQTKIDALNFIKELGIEIPVMYKLGYTNNNCVGCVKGGMGYWNKIRIDFPDTFNKMAKTERLLGYAMLKDKGGNVWLDELDPNRGHKINDMPTDCGFTCEIKESK